jgi:hypothetical protein
MARITECRTERINPDSMVTLWLTVGLVGFLAVASFMVSFTGLHEVAAWAGLPEWLRWAVPIFIDVAILAYTLAVLIHRHRGERTWASWLSLAGFTVFSMVANGAHALSIPHPDAGQQIIGAAVASLAPLAVFAATEQLGRLIIRRPEDAPVSTALVQAQPVGGPDGGGYVHGPAGTESAAADATPRVVEDAPERLIPVAEPVLPPVGSARMSSTAKDVSVFDGTADAEPTPIVIDDVPDAVATAVGADAQPTAPEPPSVKVEAEEPAGTSGPVVPSTPVPVTGTARPIRRALSVVGRAPRPTDLEEWVAAVMAGGARPTGKGAAEFLGVSERTGRTRLNELKVSNPALFTGAALKEGTHS